MIFIVVFSITLFQSIGWFVEARVIVEITMDVAWLREGWLVSGEFTVLKSTELNVDMSSVYAEVDCGLKVGVLIIFGGFEGNELMAVLLNIFWYVFAVV